MSLRSVLVFAGVVFRAGAPAFAAALLLGACSPSSSGPETGSLAPPERSSPAQQGAQPSVDVPPLAAAHKANPADAAVAQRYARALRMSGAKSEALAVLDTTAAAKPGDRPLALERGLLALDLGDTAKAEKLLRQAQDAKVPDWRLHSALGTALASRGKQQQAQAEFAKALALAPDHPSILNNLALSYALEGKVDEAEKLLRRAQRTAPGASQVPQNLALVLGLRGKFDEARKVAHTTLPPATADQNIAYLKKLESAKAVAGGPGSDRKASASLPQPTYQLGGPAEDR